MHSFYILDMFSQHKLISSTLGVFSSVMCIVQIYNCMAGFDVIVPTLDFNVQAHVLSQEH